jgi:hypothetical protein
MATIIRQSEEYRRDFLAEQEDVPPSFPEFANSWSCSRIPHT